MKRIQIHPYSWFLERGLELPAHIWRERAFNFDPQTFALTDERLQSKLIQSEVQSDSLERFEKDPTLPVVYAVASEPHDMKALYFAVYLVQTLLENVSGFKRVHWERVYSDFKNDMLYADAKLSMMVLSNITSNSSPVKLEKVRDLLDAYSDIPRVVVIAGEDPITFMSRKLFYKTNSIFFHSGALVKRRAEVI